MRKTTLFIVAWLAVTPAVAQDEPGFFGRLFGTDQAETDEQQGGLLESFIEENLSGEGRQVSIQGFQGALSGRATLDSLTIADEQGDWLTLTDVVLDWNRGALFRGRLEVTELSASEILLPRLPAPAESNEAPTPEATGFSLPELPVSLAIDKIEVERVAIGQPVFGVESLVSVAGGFRLESGEGQASLALQRQDAPGAIALEASYSNTTQILALDLMIDEGEDGIVAGLLDLPGRPAVAFSITGEAPITEYAADIRLATDGVERLQGRVTTSELEDSEEGNLRVRADVSGDVAPLFNPEYQAFFGDDVKIGTVITTFADGRVDIGDLTLTAASLSLKGQLAIGSDGLPDEIDVTGTVVSDAGPVLLPLSGPETRVDRADLIVQFDASEDDRWIATFEVEGLSRPGFSAEQLSLKGDGRIVGGDGQSVSAVLDVAARALDLGNPEAEEALGELVTGRAEIDWTSGKPLRLSALEIDGESYALRGDANVTFGDDGPSISGRADATAERLAAFSGLAKRTLGGRIDVATKFTVAPLAGTFDISATGSSDDLIVSQPQADRILEGSARLDVSMTRDETGIAAMLRTLETPNASLTGAANLRSGGSTVRISGRLDDAGIVVPSVSGPIRLNAQALEGDDRIWAWQVETSLEGTSLVASGSAIDLFGTPIVAASGRVEVGDLSDFAELANRPLAGQIATDFAGEVVADLSRASVNLDGMGDSIVIGVREIDALLEGEVAFHVDATKAGDVIAVRETEVTGEQIELRANAVLVEGAGRFDLEGQLNDASRVLDGAPSEALAFSAKGEQDGRDWDFAVGASGAGAKINATGLALDPLSGDAEFDGELRVSAEDLSIFSEISGRPLTGRIALDATGSLSRDLNRFEIATTATGSKLSVGQTQLDSLLAGDMSLTADARREGGAVEITAFDLATRLLQVSASGALATDGSEIDFDARLADISPFASGFSGPATVTGTVGQGRDGRFRINVSGNGPGGTEVAANGMVSAGFETVSVDVDGRAPLGLANSFIAPRAISGMAGFRLTIDGSPEAGSINGQVTSSDARFIAPTLGLVLNNINLTASLGGSQARVSMAAKVEDGGTISVEGPIALAAPFNANLGVGLNSVVLRDPRVFETTLDGRISTEGALAGGARISGDLTLRETNIRIPSSGLGGAGEVPEITHLNEPPPVRGTRRRAGLLDRDRDSSRTRGPVYPIDININSPNQIFIRGRGLDSELGGSLRIAGDTSNVVPIGAFNLIRGRLDILGQRLVLEEATATIEGSFVPVVRIRAITQTDDYTIAVIVAGPADDPEITFVSEPDLPQEEVLARLIFGRGLDTLSPFQAARLALAVRTLAGRSGEGVVGNIRQRVGLADLDVTTDEAGNAAVQAGAYLGENVYTDVTIGAGGDTELNLKLDVSPSVTLQGSVANSGETSLGIFYERDY